MLRNCDEGVTGLKVHTGESREWFARPLGKVQARTEMREWTDTGRALAGCVLKLPWMYAGGKWDAGTPGWWRKGHGCSRLGLDSRYGGVMLSTAAAVALRDDPLRRRLALHVVRGGTDRVGPVLNGVLSVF